MPDQWESCYDDGWQGDIVPEAFSHPAKFSRGLITRIYGHAKEMGWCRAGDYVLDPFGGVALGGLDAMSMGLNWIGVELEEKFVTLGRQNIELWNLRLKGWPNLGTARIVQGDSRRLKNSIVGMKDLIISSPPFMSSDNRSDNLSEKLPRQGRSIGESYSKEKASLGGIGGDRTSDKIKKQRIDHVKSIKNLGHIVSVGNNGQLINLDTFWSASREIVQGCFELLKNGGEPVPDGEGIDFCGGH